MLLKISNCSTSQRERKSNLLVIIYKIIFRVDFVKDEKYSDTGTFTILLEDHTLGNSIKM
jgi:hypothetical protein